MPVVIQPEAPPLRTDPDGTIRVGSSRIPIERVVQEFQGGISPTAIVEAYPTITLTDVYGVIFYYLRHSTEVDAYIAQREREADEIQRQFEAKYGSQEGLRQRLEAKLAEQG